MKNGPLMTSLTLAILAGAATQGVAAGDGAMMPHHGPRHSFEELDANGDGMLTRAEMAVHMQARFAQADADGDGKLSREELSARMESEQKKRRTWMLDRMIQQHDANGDGALSPEEMRSGRAAKMFAELDADGDGAVSQTEFEARRAMHKHGHDDGRN